MAKDKKEKKEKLSSSGISKKEHKKEKKDKKDKLVKKLIDPITGNVSDKLLSEIEKQQVGSAASVVDGEKVVKKDKKEKKDKKKDKEKDKEREKGKAKGNEKEKEGGDGQMDVDTEKTSIVELVVGNREVVDKVKVQQVKVVEGGDILVPFAVPLADEKVTKKALKTIKKGAKSKILKRGVKEVVKSVRKSPSTSTLSSPHGVVVLAADISPMDVISHIPVLCEDHNIPYVFVQSRAELGLAGGTKRPTSVIMIVPGLGRKKAKDVKEGKKDDDEGLKESYDELVKAVRALR